jgi:hypothetical protein
VSFGIVFVGFTVFLIGNFFVRPVAERLIFREAAHANPDGLLLRFNLEGLLIEFNDFAHERNLAR